MEAVDLLKFVVGVLERMGLRYAVGGSIASMYYSEPRYTNDIDIIVDLPIDRVAEFVAAFPQEEFYVSEDAARSAIKNRQQFNIIWASEGLKADIIIPSNHALDQSQLDRARRVRPRDDFEAVFATPEDVILKKLQAYAEGGSDKHLRDVASMLKIQSDRIDIEQIENWVRQLGLTDIWRAIIAAIKPS